MAEKQKNKQKNKAKNQEKNNNNQEEEEFKSQNYNDSSQKPKHPIVNLQISDLINIKTIQNGKYKERVKIVREGSLILLNYTKFQESRGGWDEYTNTCRGIVINEQSKKLVALPIPKYQHILNLEELFKQKNNIQYITEKVDGSLGICYFDEIHNKWRMNTRGSFQSDQCKFGLDILNKHVHISKLNKDLTYLFEIIYKENKILVEYGDFEGLILITAISMSKKEELDFQEVAKIFDEIVLPSSKETVIRIVKNYPIQQFLEQIEQNKKQCENLEGWVVTMNDGTKYKLKCDKYLQILKLKSNMTPFKIWSICSDFKVDLEFIRRTLPDELYKEFDEILMDFQHKHKQIFNQIIDLKNQLEPLSQKNANLKMTNDSISSFVRAQVNNLRKENQDIEEVKQAIWASLKPSETQEQIVQKEKQTQYQEEQKIQQTKTNLTPYNMWLLITQGKIEMKTFRESLQKDQREQYDSITKDLIRKHTSIYNQIFNVLDEVEQLGQKKGNQKMDTLQVSSFVRTQVNNLKKQNCDIEKVKKDIWRELKPTENSDQNQEQNQSQSEQQEQESQQSQQIKQVQQLIQQQQQIVNDEQEEEKQQFNQLQNQNNKISQEQINNDNDELNQNEKLLTKKQLKRKKQKLLKQQNQKQQDEQEHEQDKGEVEI